MVLVAGGGGSSIFTMNFQQAAAGVSLPINSPVFAFSPLVVRLSATRNMKLWVSSGKSC